MKRHLFVALSRSGWGETSLGAQVARQVAATGDQVVFVVHVNGKTALGNLVCRCVEVSDKTLPLTPLLLQTCLTGKEFSSIVLCDFLTTNYTLRRFGVDPEFLFRFNLPVLTLDTWEYDKTGSQVDVFGTQQWDIGSWIGRTNGRLIPVPIGSPDTKGAYCSLPSPEKIGSATRRHIRSNIGVDADKKAVLFCTAEWQHGTHGSAHPKIADLLPEILGGYLARSDPRIQLIHIGPRELTTGLNGRYLWMPPVTPLDFDRLLNSVDLVLSANISQTTIAKAIALGVPVLAVKNSHEAKTVEELEAAVPGGLSPQVKAWVEKVLPLFPFSMWPLGFWKFLKPLLETNPYRNAVNTVELTDDAGFITGCERLLFDKEARAEVTRQQSDYTQLVRSLPSANVLINQYLNA